MNDTKRAQMGRLKWHSRRALLELDIVLERFWAQKGDDLDDRSAVALTRLLALEDHDLWDLVSGRVDTDDPELCGFIGVLRGTEAGMLNKFTFTN
jgi:succinate dehydrogenase flavin-adding protein (antitoxin of CptAB toxin-antitoxin module)